MDKSTHQMTPTITVCMIVKDEAENLAQSLPILVRQFEEIIVVDTGSIDNTKQVSESFPKVKVFQTEWLQDFAIARNQSISHATGDYILILDADESVPKNARDILKRFIRQFPDALGITHVESDQLTEQGEHQQVISHITRFFPNHPTIRYHGRIHEQVIDLSGTRAKRDTRLTIKHRGYALDAANMEKKSLRNLRLLNMALNEEPQSGYYHYQKGKSLDQIKRYSEAVASYALGMQYSSREQAFYPELLLAYLYGLKRIGDQERLWALVNEALQWYPDYPDLYFFIGSALIQLQVPALDTIRESFETCLKLGDKSDRYPSVLGTGSFLAAYNLGAFYQSLKDFPQAKKYYQLAAKAGYAPAKTRLQQIQS